MDNDVGRINDSDTSHGPLYGVRNVIYTTTFVTIYNKGFTMIFPPETRRNYPMKAYGCYIEYRWPLVYTIVYPRGWVVCL